MIQPASMIFGRAVFNLCVSCMLNFLAIRICIVSDDKFCWFSKDSAAVVRRVPLKCTAVYFSFFRAAIGNAETTAKERLVVRKSAVLHFGINSITAEAAAVAVTCIRGSQLAIVESAAGNRYPAISCRCTGIQCINIEAAAVTLICDTVLKVRVCDRNILGVKLQTARCIRRAICERATDNICPGSIIKVNAMKNSARLVDCGTVSEITAVKRHCLCIRHDRTAAQSVRSHRCC